MRKPFVLFMGGVILTLACEAVESENPAYTAVFCSPPELSSLEGVTARAALSGKGNFDLIASEDSSSSVEIPAVPSGKADLRLVFLKGDLPIAETTRTLDLSAAETVLVRVETCKIEFPDSDGDGISNLDENLIPGADAIVMSSGTSLSDGVTTWGSAVDCTASTKDCFAATVTVAGRTRAFSHEPRGLDANWDESTYYATNGEVEGKCGYVRADFDTTPDGDGDIYRVLFNATLNQTGCPAFGSINAPGEIRLDRYVAEIQLFQTLGVGGIDSARSRGRLTVKDLGSGVGALFSGTFDVKLPKKSMVGSFRFTRRADR